MNIIIQLVIPEVFLKCHKDKKCHKMCVFFITVLIKQLIQFHMFTMSHEALKYATIDTNKLKDILSIARISHGAHPNDQISSEKLSNTRSPRQNPVQIN